MHVTFEYSSFGQSDPQFYFVELPLDYSVLTKRRYRFVFKASHHCYLTSAHWHKLEILNLSSANSISDMVSGSWLHATLRSKYLL